MSGDAGSVAMAALLDAVTLLRGEMATLTRSNERIEAGQKELHQRLDTIEAFQAELANVAPFLQDHVAKTVQGNEAAREAQWLRCRSPPVAGGIQYPFPLALRSGQRRS
jgi:uncharacterized protein (DUF3084 family)